LAAIVAAASRGYGSVNVSAPGRALKHYIEGYLGWCNLRTSPSSPFNPSGPQELRIFLIPEVSLRGSIPGEDVRGLREGV
ncbi:MAG: hypothetical protein ACK4H7_04355, partial [Acidilobaceae archaeon]